MACQNYHEGPGNSTVSRKSDCTQGMEQQIYVIFTPSGSTEPRYLGDDCKIRGREVELGTSRRRRKLPIRSEELYKSPQSVSWFLPNGLIPLHLIRRWSFPFLRKKSCVITEASGPLGAAGAGGRRRCHGAIEASRELRPASSYGPGNSES